MSIYTISAKRLTLHNNFYSFTAWLILKEISHILKIYGYFKFDFFLNLICLFMYFLNHRKVLIFPKVYFVRKNSN